MKNLKFCTLSLGLIILWSNIDTASASEDKGPFVIEPADFASQDSESRTGTLAAALPKGIQKLKRGGIRISKDSNIKIVRISRSEVLLSGGILKASDKKVSCSGNCSCDLKIKRFPDPALECDGDCDSCSMATTDVDELKAKSLEVGFNSSSDGGCLVVEDVERKIAYAN